MTETRDPDLYQRTKALLEPGDIELDGAVVHTELESGQEARLHQTTLDVGDIIAAHAAKGDTYVYSGNDDPEFGVNQHQGLTIESDEFVWECQQLLRAGTYDVVFYYEATADQESIIADIRSAGHDVVGVRGD